MFGCVCRNGLISLANVVAAFGLLWSPSSAHAQIETSNRVEPHSIDGEPYTSGASWPSDVEGTGFTIIWRVYNTTYLDDVDNTLQLSVTDQIGTAIEQNGASNENMVLARIHSYAIDRSDPDFAFLSFVGYCVQVRTWSQTCTENLRASFSLNVTRPGSSVSDEVTFVLDVPPLDTHGPEFDITGPASYTTDQPFTVEIESIDRWSEIDDLSGAGVDPENLIEVTGANVIYSLKDEFTYIATTTPTGGPIGVFIPPGAATGTADGLDTEAGTASIGDKLKPFVVSTDALETFENSDEFTISYTFNESVNIEDREALALENASLTGGISTRGPVVTLSITPVQETAALSVTLGEGLFVDDAFNQNVSNVRSIGSSSGAVPGVMATISPDKYRYTTPFVATITFSELLDDRMPLTLDSLSARFATLSDLRQASENEYTVMVAPDGIHDAEITLEQNAVTGVSGTGNAATTLVISNEGYVAETSQVIARFMSDRAGQILRSRPDYVALASCGSSSGGTFNLNADGSGYTSAFRADHCRERPSEWTGWSTVSINHSNINGRGLNFSLAQFGVHRLFTRQALFGIMGQIDYASQKDPASNSEASGFGFMIGPYAVVDLPAIGSTFIFEASWGRSINTVNPVALYQDEFETERFLIASSISGSLPYGKWDITPSASARYFRETQESYRDTVGLVIPEQTIALGEFEFSGQFSRGWLLDNGITLGLSGTLSGIYTFEMLDGSLDATYEVYQGMLRPRFELGLGANNGSLSARIDGFNDGFGIDGYNAWGTNLSMGVKF